MIDFDALVNGTVESTFGQACSYLPQGAALPVAISATFFEGYLALDDGLPPPAQASRPHLGVQVSQILAVLPTFDPKACQGDMVTVADGRVYVVKSGQPDGTGWTNLELQLVPAP